MDASGINSNSRKKALLLHLAETNTQDIFETLFPNNATYKAAVEALNTVEPVYNDHFWDH